MYAAAGVRQSVCPQNQARQHSLELATADGAATAVDDAGSSPTQPQLPPQEQSLTWEW